MEGNAALETAAFEPAALETTALETALAETKVRYQAYLDVREPRWPAPSLSSTCIEAGTVEAVLAILAEYGIEEADSFVVVRKWLGKTGLEMSEDVYESTAFTARVDTLARCEGSAVAWWRAWQRLCRTAGKREWLLGPPGEVGKLSLNFRAIPYYQFQPLATCLGQLPKLLEMGVVAYWDAGRGGDVMAVYPTSYLTANGSRLRKAFDSQTRMATSLLEAWRSHRRSNWCSHPLDEMLNAIADQTCRLPVFAPEVRLPEELKAQACALARQPKEIKGCNKLVIVDAARIAMEKDAYWNASSTSLYYHNDVAALERIAAHLQNGYWFIMDNHQAMIAMGSETLKRWSAEAGAGGIVQRCEEMDRFLGALPGSTVSLVALNQGADCLTLAVKPIGAILRERKASPVFRMEILHNGTVIDDFRAHHALQVVERVNEAINKTYPPAVVATLGHSTHNHASKRQERINYVFNDLKDIPRLFAGHLGSDLAFVARCRELAIAMRELIAWSNLDFVTRTESGEHAVGCQTFSSYSLSEHNLVHSMERKFCEKAGSTHAYRFIAQCECKLLEWLESMGASSYKTVPAYQAAA